MNRGAIETKAAIKRAGWTHKDGKINFAQAGRELNCDPSNLDKILKGERGPGRVTAELARAKLGVEVPLWDEPHRAKVRSAKGHAA